MNELILIKKDIKFIIYNPETKLFDFFIESLMYELSIKNIMYTYINKIFNENDIEYLLQNNQIYIILIIINPHFIFNNINIYNNLILINNKFKYKILYITEPINFIIEKKIYVDIIQIIKPYVLWTYTYENFNKLNIYQKMFKIFPTFNQTHIFVENITLDNIKDRNKDNIIFFGNINDTRKDICNKFNKYLINKTDSYTKTEWTEILTNNLIYLNIHRRLNCKSFESFRIIPILSNCGVIISERVNEIEEKIYSKYNIIFAEKNDLYNVYIDYIKNINYEDIYNKYILFKKDMLNNNNDLDTFLHYHNLL
jgi:hypothetical protein